jgi:hypothetical protein
MLQLCRGAAVASRNAVDEMVGGIESASAHRDLPLPDAVAWSRYLALPAAVDWTRQMASGAKTSIFSASSMRLFL